MLTLPGQLLQVSFAISTYRRRDVLMRTLSNVFACGLSRDAFEVLVVDNASPDGSADAVERFFPDARLFREPVNRGSCAKNIALGHARGRFVVFLDDDSYPVPGAVARMVRRFDEQPDLAAAVFTVNLVDGSRECSAYPDVFIGCGTGFRRRALAEVGGLPTDFFMQAEEYDLSLRLLNAGWRVRTFDDLHVTHLKAPGAHRARRVTRLDVRNNLILAARHFPDRWVRPFAADWLRRYYKLAAARRQRVAFFAGAVQGLAAAAVEGKRRRPVSDEAFESFARVDEIERRLRSFQEANDLRSVLFIDLGKNILPYWIAAKRLGIEIVAIADQNLTRGGTRDPGRYRGIPIVDDSEARSYTYDAAVVSNTSPVHAAARRTFWRRFDHFRPVIDLFEFQKPPEALDTITRHSEQLAPAPLPVAA